MSADQAMERSGEVAEAEEFELAFARLEWARQSACLHLPAQREALRWHLACCDAALAALTGAPLIVGWR